MNTNSMNTARHHYRVVRPVRFFLFVLITTIVISFACFSLVGAGTAEAAAESTYKQVVVHENDSLWSIASKYNPDVHDVRSLVYEIYEINDIDADDILQPGDVVFVPVY